ncbi:MAG: AmmeMemoRadiSam system protein B [Candidatus Omnitrophica bacterium]|nr:AmmeMemoRadiSam system protein B [Candidatus Omnitrophota bacterium]
MKKNKVLLVLFLLVCSNTCFAQQVKAPVASGTYYPASPKILSERIKQFLEWAEVKKADKRILALIAPHAGYDYSGGVAAHAYKLIKAQPISTVIVIGPSHYVRFEGFSVYSTGNWQTPLGNVPIDTEIAQALIEYDPKILFYEPAFEKEHSLEVQIPFLQMVLDDFKIVPIATGNLSYENCQLLSEALLTATKDRDDILIVASTDLSHYHPYLKANEIDGFTIDGLKKFDPQSLYYKFITEECQACGVTGVIATLLYAKAKGIADVEILKYANSGDVTGDKSRVVGYLSAAIYANPAGNPVSGAAGAEEEKMVKENREMLSPEEKKRLLEIARETLDKYVLSEERLEVKEDNPDLMKEMGAFVTIHKQGRLRGCIGNIIGRQPLYLTVRDMAIEAASNDPRFPAVASDELKDIDIEISVLSQPKKVEDVNQIEMGVHGVIVKRGYASGVFLPQVATETGWQREEFLSNLCAHKAGLDPLAWKQEGTELYSFTAQVFGEKENN